LPYRHTTRRRHWEFADIRSRLWLDIPIRLADCTKLPVVPDTGHRRECFAIASGCRGSGTRFDVLDAAFSLSVRMLVNVAVTINDD
jgi:hypothetical protein